MVCYVDIRVWTTWYSVLTSYAVKLTWDKTRQFSTVLDIFETEQLQIGNWVETRQNCLVLSPIQFTPPTHGQDNTAVSFV